MCAHQGGSYLHSYLLARGGKKASSTEENREYIHIGSGNSFRGLYTGVTTDRQRGRASPQEEGDLCTILCSGVLRSLPPEMELVM